MGTEGNKEGRSLFRSIGVALLLISLIFLFVPTFVGGILFAVFLLTGALITLAPNWVAALIRLSLVARNSKDE